MPTESPFARAAIRDGVITLHAWSPRLIRGGPRVGTLDSLSAALADLSCTGDNDLIVTPVIRGQLNGSAAAALALWAGTVGYRRLWLPGQIIDLDDRPALIGCVAVRCPTCSAHWRDAQVEFWEHVREQGAFPGRCMACGGVLPEWELVHDTPPMGALTASAPRRQVLSASDGQPARHDSLRNGNWCDGAARTPLPRPVASGAPGVQDGGLGFRLFRTIGDARHFRGSRHPLVSTSRADSPGHAGVRRAVARISDAIVGARARVARTDIE